MSLKNRLTAAFMVVAIAVAPASAQDTKASPYKDTPGNEFQVLLTSPAFPDGKWVTVDPDDMLIAQHPQTGKPALAPRMRMLTGINAQLPPAGAVEAAAPRPGQETTPYGTLQMLKHLTDPKDKGGHGIELSQIKAVFRLCNEPNGLTPPPKKSGDADVQTRPVPAP